MEIQGRLRQVSLPQPEGCRLKLKLSEEGTVLAVLFYHVVAVDEYVAKVELGMVARHVSCQGEGLGDDAMKHFWACLRSDLQGPPTPQEVHVSAIVRPDNSPSKKLMSGHGLTMLVDVDAEGWETWGVVMPWDQTSESLETRQELRFANQSD